LGLNARTIHTERALKAQTVNSPHLPLL